MVAGSRLWVPVRNFLSVSWAIVNASDRLPVPAAATITEALALIEQLNQNYTPDPWDGRFDLSEDPRRVYYHLIKKSIKRLAGLDCDDIAYFAYALIRNIVKWRKCVILTDGNGKFTHMVCQFRMFDGRTGVLDTNGLTWLEEGETLCARFDKIYASYGARYIDENPVEYLFSDPGKVA